MDEQQPAPPAIDDNPAIDEHVITLGDETPSPDPETPTPAPDGDGEPAAEPGDAGAGTQEGAQTETPPAKPDTDVPGTPRTDRLADPGTEFTPQGEYAFDVTLADGTSVRIEKPEDIDNLPPDADFGTPANLMKAQAALNKMVNGIDQERREFETAKAAYEQQAQADQAVQERVNTMVAEIGYLQAQGKLPKVDPKYEQSDWSDPEVAKQPGVKEVLELIDYRNAQNVERAKYNLPPMSMLEAQLTMQTEAASQAEADQKQKDAELRKSRGAMVGGVSPGIASNVPDNVIMLD